MKEVLTSIFSSEGKISSSRIGFYITLLTVCGCAIYDTVHNGKLDPAVAAIVVSAGTIGYGISKNKEVPSNE